MAGKGHLLLFSLLSLLFSISIHARFDLHPSDSKALSALQIDLGVNNQPDPTNATSAHSYNLEGVFWERRLSNNESYILRITRLVFKSKHLNGVLSPAIGHLTELKQLSLSNNHLVGQIPPQIVDCRKLEILELSNNLFSGQVPSELSSLIRLRVLDVSSNKLSGNLNFLRYRYFPNLETLSVADNLFNGRVPTPIRSFRNLRHFNFSGHCFLEGSTLPRNKRLECEYEHSALDTVPKCYVFTETRNGSLAAAPAVCEKKSTAAEAPGPAVAVPPHKHKSSKRKLTRWILWFVAGALALTISGFITSLTFKFALALKIACICTVDDPNERPNSKDVRSMLSQINH